MRILGDPGADSGGEGKSKRAKNMARRKVRNGEKSPWGQCLTRPVSNGRRRSAFWFGRKTQKFSVINQKSERRRPFATGLLRHCPQGLFSLSPPLSAPGSPRMSPSRTRAKIVEKERNRRPSWPRLAWRWLSTKWLPETVGACSRRSYGTIGDCEQQRFIRRGSDPFPLYIPFLRKKVQLYPFYQNLD